MNLEKQLEYPGRQLECLYGVWGMIFTKNGVWGLIFTKKSQIIHFILFFFNVFIDP